MKKSFLVFFCLISVQLLFSQVRRLDKRLGGFDRGGLNQKSDSVYVFENPVHDFISNGIYTVILAVTNPCGTKYYQEDIQITGVGIQQVKFTNIKIYPNPASSFVTIKGIDSYEVDIYDVIGTLMLSTSDKEIDVSNIPRGTYFVIVKDTNGILLKTEKLIIH